MSASPWAGAPAMDYHAAPKERKAGAWAMRYRSASGATVSVMVAVAVFVAVGVSAGGAVGVIVIAGGTGLAMGATDRGHRERSGRRADHSRWQRRKGIGR